MANFTCCESPEVLVGDATSLGDTTNLEIKSLGEALSTFIRASRDPKGEHQVCVVKSDFES